MEEVIYACISIGSILLVFYVIHLKTLRKGYTEIIERHAEERELLRLEAAQLRKQLEEKEND